MSAHLERCLRDFVARGAGLDADKVRPGNAKAARPKDPYATLLLLNDVRRSQPEFIQLNDATTGGAAGTLQLTPRRATYSLQFYRDGAAALAELFDYYAMSEAGLIDADTSFASGNGALKAILMRDSGSGYTTPPAVTISGPGGSGATAEASIVSGAVSGIGLTNAGSGYVDASIAIEGNAVATVIGWGFTVVHPLTIRRIDDILGEAFEERAGIDLPIDYTHWDVQTTGRVDAWRCNLVDGVSGRSITGTVAAG